MLHDDGAASLLYAPTQFRRQIWIRGFSCHPESARIQSPRATRSDLERYRQFFGIVSDQELKEEADALKEKGDFTSPDSFKVRVSCCARQLEHH